MFDQVFANLAVGFSQAFGGPYADGQLNYAGTPTTDAGGSITAPGTPFSVPCSIQVDRATEAMRASPEFLQKDVALLILGPEQIDTSAVAEVFDGKFAGKVYSLQSAERDPAGIGWLCRGREVS